MLPLKVVLISLTLVCLVNASGDDDFDSCDDYDPNNCPVYAKQGKCLGRITEQFKRPFQLRRPLTEVDETVSINADCRRSCVKYFKAHGSLKPEEMEFVQVSQVITLHQDVYLLSF